MTYQSQTRRCAYQDQDSPMTLREGLDEYYRMNPEVTPPEEASEEGEQFFHSHDVTHVVFGTTTTFRDEGINDLWSMYGLDISMREYVGRGLEVPEVKALFKEFGTWAFIKELAKFPGYWPKVRRQAKKMTKPWPWKGYADYLDVPLAQVRREFGIEVLGPEGV